MKKFKVATIKGQDSSTITILAEDSTWRVSLDNGEEVPYGDTPTSPAEAFELIHSLWGSDENFELEFAAEYDVKGIYENE